MIEAGCAVAIATDFNPGSCYTQSMSLIHTLACVKLKMTAAEALVASTINAAFSLRCDAEVGTLHAGKRADLVALQLPSTDAVGYAFGGNPVVVTIVGGKPVVANGCERLPELFGGDGR
jgi:imidazolonepropionase